MIQINEKLFETDWFDLLEFSYLVLINCRFIVD
jgi:hypothetical protein